MNECECGKREERLMEYNVRIESMLKYRNIIMKLLLKMM